ncbi:Gfo/Idh/MocA family oxidoreductase [Tamlana fucoidanivorans]|uniref:Gfo/Idh/MocA family oxidoreductase n=1 Tax=Allotamlana fucoidanivorans TaxID=2583814 RepID=A0A5C4SF29_9FLAO|nr:Gfo/Idh/MocA family oxidoreductase [Tamlana fucoidanivorans]TNJ42190.1 Gfo/Idh/MocA family oxidoreductase [Tamlana fucoidanivorans]
MELIYKPELPKENRPIYIIGAGGIVRDAHLPAYKNAGFNVAGITNRTKQRAIDLANTFNIPNVFDDVEAMVEAAPENAVYDLTLMPNQFVPTLDLLPDNAAVLIQKPMGDNYEQTLDILEVCRRKKLKAAINCQMRYAPYVMAAKYMIDQGHIGELYDFEVRLTTYTPWEYFPNVVNHPRLEIQQHSIHYIDLIRSFLGNPKKVYAKTLKNPGKPMSSTRTTTIMDYNDSMRAIINTNHDHNFGEKNQESFVKWEGTKGAIKARIGLLLDYPNGKPDLFQYCIVKEGETPKWIEVDLEGSWFPDAFVGTMASLMRYIEGSTDVLPTSVEDVVHSMAIVEAAYDSNDDGGVTPLYNA